MPLPGDRRGGSPASRAAPRASAAAARRGAGSSRASEPRIVRTSAPPAPSCSSTSVDHPLVGRGGGREHRPPAGSAASRSRMPAVVGPEVVAPVADAVGLVDDQQPGRVGEPRQLLVAEPRVVEPLGADEQQVDLVGARARRRPSSHSSALAELMVTARTPGALGGRDLVAHQRQQRRHDDRRPAPRRPQQQRWRRSRRRTCPSRCAARPARAGHRRPAPRSPRAARRGTRLESSPTSRRSTLSASARNEGSTSVARSMCGSVSGVVIEATLAAGSTEPLSRSGRPASRQRYDW